MTLRKTYVGMELVEQYDYRHFGGAAGRYVFEKDIAILTSLLRPPPGLVIDVPCGTGIYSERLRNAGYDVVAADASLPMLEMAGRRKVGMLRMLSDINALPFPEGSFDAIMTIRLFQHYPRADVARMLGELRRVIKPDGLIVFDTFRWTPRSLPVVRSFLPRNTMVVWASRDVEMLIRNAGLRKVREASCYLFSPIWQRKLPLPVVKGLSALEGVLPQPWLLRTFWACTHE